jgi:hypothetical protein
MYLNVRVARDADLQKHGGDDLGSFDSVPAHKRLKSSTLAELKVLSKGSQFRSARCSLAMDCTPGLTRAVPNASHRTIARVESISLSAAGVFVEHYGDRAYEFPALAVRAARPDGPCRLESCRR